MSVILMLNYTPNGYEISVPIAAEEIFVRFWLPLARKKSLTYIIDMHWGYPINYGNLANIINELKIMKDAFINENELSDGYRDFFKKRIDDILEKIEPELENPRVEGFVG